MQKNRGTNDIEVHDISDEVFEAFDKIHELNGRGLYANTYPELKKSLFTIWKDKGVWKKGQRSKVWKSYNAGKSSENELAYANAVMCLKFLDKIFDDGFSLSHDDFVRVRNPTLIMSKTKGIYHGEKFQLVDVGGQLHFREEWISALSQFKGNCAVIFVISLADYDREDSKWSGNRFKSCLDTWIRLLNNVVMKKIPVFLLLNKEDLFHKKLEQIPLSTCPLLKHFRAKAGDESATAYYARCTNAVLQIFNKSYCSQSHGADFCYELPSYTTCATDMKMVEAVISKIVSSLNKASAMEMFEDSESNSPFLSISMSESSREKLRHSWGRLKLRITVVHNMRNRDEDGGSSCSKNIIESEQKLCNGNVEDSGSTKGLPLSVRET
jgi:GTPase SAR1 family protein